MNFQVVSVPLRYDKQVARNLWMIVLADIQPGAVEDNRDKSLFSSLATKLPSGLKSAMQKSDLACED
jgi:hypothetical protein